MLSTNSIYAEGNIHYGRLNVKPKIDSSISHDSNIFSDADNEVEDTIFIFNPGIMFEYLDNRPENYFQTGYDLKLASYFKRNNNNYQTHEPYIRFGIRTPTGFIARFSERYMKTADPLGSKTSYGKGERTSRSENTIDFTFGQYFTDRLSIETMYQNYGLRYRDWRDQEFQDRTDNIFSLGMYMLLTHSRKTSLLAEYRFTDGKYDRQESGTSTDHNINTFLVGLRFEPGGKLMGSAKLGFEDKSFDNEIDKNGYKLEDNSTWVIETNVLFQMSDITNFVFQFIRSIEGSPDRDAASYVDTNIGFDLRHQVHHKTFFNSGLNWVNSDYRDERDGIPNKYFNLYTLYLGFEYDMKEWLKVTGKYKYETKTASHSNFYSSEYSGNTLFLGMDANF
jgi:opacity protein-like surface antigen